MITTTPKKNPKKSSKTISKTTLIKKSTYNEIITPSKKFDIYQMKTTSQHMLSPIDISINPSMVSAITPQISSYPTITIQQHLSIKSPSNNNAYNFEDDTHEYIHVIDNCGLALISSISPYNERVYRDVDINHVEPLLNADYLKILSQDIADLNALAKECIAEKCYVCDFGVDINHFTPDEIAYCNFDSNDIKYTSCVDNHIYSNLDSDGCCGLDSLSTSSDGCCGVNSLSAGSNSCCMDNLSTSSDECCGVNSLSTSSGECCGVNSLSTSSDECCSMNNLSIDSNRCEVDSLSAYRNNCCDIVSLGTDINRCGVDSLDIDSNKCSLSDDNNRCHNMHNSTNIGCNLPDGNNEYCDIHNVTINSNSCSLKDCNDGCNIRHMNTDNDNYNHSNATDKDNMQHKDEDYLAIQDILNKKLSPHQLMIEYGGKYIYLRQTISTINMPSATMYEYIDDISTTNTNSTIYTIIDDHNNSHDDNNCNHKSSQQYVDQMYKTILCLTSDALNDKTNRTINNPSYIEFYNSCHQKYKHLLMLNNASGINSAVFGDEELQNDTISKCINYYLIMKGGGYNDDHIYYMNSHYFLLASYFLDIMHIQSHFKDFKAEDSTELRYERDLANKALNSKLRCGSWLLRHSSYSRTYKCSFGNSYYALSYIKFTNRSNICHKSINHVLIRYQVGIGWSSGAHTPSPEEIFPSFLKFFTFILGQHKLSYKDQINGL